MSLYERLAGDTRQFAFMVGFDPDPENGQGATRDESISWGRFQVWVDGINLCAHREDGVSLPAVHWYLLPLLEWLVEQWDFLLHEERLPAKASAADAASSLSGFQWATELREEEEAHLYEWWARHSLLSCRNGGAFPNVIFRRRGDGVEVSWDTAPLPGLGEHLQFVERRGVRSVASEDVAEPLSCVIRDAVAYLRQQAPDSPRLAALGRKVRQLSSPRRRPLRLALLAGLGRSANDALKAWGKVSRRIRHRAKTPEAAEAVLGTSANDLVIPGTCQAALMFGSVSPELDAQDVCLLADTLVSLYSRRGEPETLTALVRMCAVSSFDPPWAEGYRLAEDLLDKLGLPRVGDEMIDVERLVSDIGVRTEEIELCDREVRAVAVAGPHHRPTILVNSAHVANSYPAGRRFTLAHELCHVLHDRSYHSTLALASGPWAPPDVERRANAFAAMLLAPPSLLSRAMKLLAAPLGEPEGIKVLADRLGVGYSSLLSHLRNLGYIDEGARERILEQVAQRRP